METKSKNCCANFGIDIEDVKAVIASYPSGKFDSHKVIVDYVNKFPSKYGGLLQKHNNVARVNSEISRFLGNNDKALNITKIGETYSVNILGNITECADWEKL